MKKFTLEDAEYIRSRADISYDEVIALLEAYEGDVVQVMADLERQGKLKAPAHEESTPMGLIKKLFKKGFNYRFIVKRETETILNISILFSLFSLVLAPHVFIVGLIVALLLGYKISFKSRSFDMDLGTAARTAKETVQKAVKSFSEPEEGDAPSQSGTDASAEASEIIIE
ncbi:DUF4342 domain-containing protein [Oscillospiraceae bacterium OttesenSCG-928-G22]|nr:DUF4342 domain-containing protein [Oscillospiraceae bacterium OttesenSCG-928-G22]